MAKLNNEQKPVEQATPADEQNADAAVQANQAEAAAAAPKGMAWFKVSQKAFIGGQRLDPQRTPFVLLPAGTKSAAIEPAPDYRPPG